MSPLESMKGVAPFPRHEVSAMLAPCGGNSQWRGVTCSLLTATSRLTGMFALMWFMSLFHPVSDSMWEHQIFNRSTLCPLAHLWHFRSFSLVSPHRFASGFYRLRSIDRLKRCGWRTCQPIIEEVGDAILQSWFHLWVLLLFQLHAKSADSTVVNETWRGKYRTTLHQQSWAKHISKAKTWMIELKPTEFSRTPKRSRRRKVLGGGWWWMAERLSSSSLQICVNHSCQPKPNPDGQICFFRSSNLLALNNWIHAVV